MTKILLRTWPLALCLVFFFTFTSCQKGDDPKPVDPAPSTCRIAKFYDAADPTQYTIYQYGNQNRVLQAKGFYKEKEKSLVTYDYNSQGQLITLDVSVKDFQQNYIGRFHQVYTFEYNTQGQISKCITSDLIMSNPGPISEAICEYDSEGNRIKITTTTNAPTSPFVNYYTYENGNCIKAILNQGQETERTYVYEFDLTKENKLRAFDQTPSLTNRFGQTANKNMLKSETRTFKEDSAINGPSQYTHEYNELGYPIKQVVTSSSGYGTSTKTRIIEYDCQ